MIRGKLFEKGYHPEEVEKKMDRWWRGQIVVGYGIYFHGKLKCQGCVQIGK
jgi:hypothetical protein